MGADGFQLSRFFKVLPSVRSKFSFLNSPLSSNIAMQVSAHFLLLWFTGPHEPFFGCRRTLRNGGNDVQARR